MRNLVLVPNYTIYPEDPFPGLQAAKLIILRT